MTNEKIVPDDWVVIRSDAQGNVHRETYLAGQFEKGDSRDPNGRLLGCQGVWRGPLPGGQIFAGSRV